MLNGFWVESVWILHGFGIDSVWILDLDILDILGGIWELNVWSCIMFCLVPNVVGGFCVGSGISMDCFAECFSW